MTVTTTAAFQVGSLVRARGREWVVLPESTPDLLVLQPLGGGVDDIAGVLPDIERVTPASFPPPTPDDLGDDRSARLLRDALRIGFRSSGGPFRCLAGIAVVPRPYQLVPLLLALRQDTVRLLIADDVGIGKTIEAGLIAAELLATGNAARLAVLCPPSLAEQWRGELATKFGLEAELVLPGTITRLERNLGYGQSVFEAHQVTIVSTDFIKAEHRRNDFLRAAPDLVIIDEAHTVSSDDSGRGSAGRTQRYRLVRDLAADPNRHLLLVTATPHSGNDTAFRNLIGLTNPDLREADLGSDAGRALLAEHMVQRRRADIRSYLGADTQFPADRKTAEVAYTLSPAHRALFDDVLAYVRGQVQDKTGTKLQQRIRWWSALSLLRSMASSPAAAAATLSTRAANVEAHSSDAADAIGAAEILDQVEDDSLDSADATPGALVEDDTSGSGERPAAPSPTDHGHQPGRPTDRRRQARPADHPGQGPAARRVPPDRVRPVHPHRPLRRRPPQSHPEERRRRGRHRRAAQRGTRHPRRRPVRGRRVRAQGAGGHRLPVRRRQPAGRVPGRRPLRPGLEPHPPRTAGRPRRPVRPDRPRRQGPASSTARTTASTGSSWTSCFASTSGSARTSASPYPSRPQSDQVLAALLEGILMRGQQADQLTLDLGVDTAAQTLDEQWRSTAEAGEGVTHPVRARPDPPRRGPSRRRRGPRQPGHPRQCRRIRATPCSRRPAPSSPPPPADSPPTSPWPPSGWSTPWAAPRSPCRSSPTCPQPGAPPC